MQVVNQVAFNQLVVNQVAVNKVTVNQLVVHQIFFLSPSDSFYSLHLVLFTSLLSHFTLLTCSLTNRSIARRGAAILASNAKQPVNKAKAPAWWAAARGIGTK